MSNNVWFELTHQLEMIGRRVSSRADSFQRERAALLDEIKDRQFGRAFFGPVRIPAGLVSRVNDLVIRGRGLHDLFERIDQIEEQLNATTETLERIAAYALRAPDCLPATLDRLRDAMGRLGQQVKTEDDLMLDRHRCDEIEATNARLNDVLALWLSVEARLTEIPASAQVVALDVALPRLAERLCREGPTPLWYDEICAFVRRLRQFQWVEERIRHLSDRVKMLGMDPDESDALLSRLMSVAKNWTGEDDQPIEELISQAKRVEHVILKEAISRTHERRPLDRLSHKPTDLLVLQRRLIEELRAVVETPHDGMSDNAARLDELLKPIEPSRNEDIEKIIARLLTPGRRFNDIAARLDGLREIKSGWLDGRGFAPSSKGLDWLAQSFESHYPDVLPPPYLYPTPEGGVQAEWSLGTHEVTLEIDMDRRVGEWHSLDTRTQADDWKELDLAQPESWTVIATEIERMQGLAGEHP